jgi:hypothetical protein
MPGTGFYPPEGSIATTSMVSVPAGTVGAIAQCVPAGTGGLRSGWGACPDAHEGVDGAVIRAGNLPSGAIASHVSRKANELAHPLTVLEDAGWSVVTMTRSGLTAATSGSTSRC